VKIIAVGAIVGAVVCVLGLTTFGAIYVFVNGAILGPCAAVPEHTLGAAVFGAFCAMKDSASAAGLGLLIGAIIGTVVHLCHCHNHKRG
jgi:hypothetical protein